MILQPDTDGCPEEHDGDPTPIVDKERVDLLLSAGWAPVVGEDLKLTGEYKFENLVLDGEDYPDSGEQWMLFERIPAEDRKYDFDHLRVMELGPRRRKYWPSLPKLIDALVWTAQRNPGAFQGILRAFKPPYAVLK